MIFQMTDIHTAFVTGGTGLLGNNLVRALRAQGVTVRALVRSMDKAKQQFGDQTGIEFVVGDMMRVSDFAPALTGCDVVFHTAAFFRDSYKGGRHVQALRQTNVDGTAQLLAAAWDAGVRTFIHTSSIAVLDGKGGAPIRESDERHPDRADDYYLSKIQSEGVVRDFAKRHPDFRVCHVLPGWMWGPGDLGPTASGQLAADVLARKLPGLVPGSFSVVDARDVALAHIAAARQGRSGERYLAAGRHMTMADLIPLIGQAAQVPTPKRRVPWPLLFLIAWQQELRTKLTGKPALVSLANVRLMRREEGRSHFDATRFERELGLRFRPIEDTLRDTVDWLLARQASQA